MSICGWLPHSLKFCFCYPEPLIDPSYEDLKATAHSPEASVNRSSNSSPALFLSEWEGEDDSCDADSESSSVGESEGLYSQFLHNDAVRKAGLCGDYEVESEDQERVLAIVPSGNE